MENDAQKLRNRFVNAGQGHLFRHWDALSLEGRKSLLDQASQIDLDEVKRLHETLVVSTEGGKMNFEGIEPSPFIPCPAKGDSHGEALWAKARADGEAALRAGRVGAFVVAGGQGTRLGFDGPKGSFPVTPVRKATLFQVFAEKLLCAGRTYGFTPHWFILTSQINHAATEAFFRQNHFFGLPESHVHLFMQGLMPAIEPNGKIILEDRSSIAMSPDGHGGSLRALVRSGSIALMEKAGIDIISYFQVDNPLVQPFDPAFIGFHLQSGSEMSSKMLPKTHAKEKVGNFCSQNGQVCVIEYSDLPDALAERRLPDGQLAFRAGSIAIHLLDRAFVKRMGGNDTTLALPFHRANKKVPFYDDAQGKTVTPDKTNGIKFEMFVFDALPFARNPIVIETRREDEFSPVKNAEGVDSAQSARQDQLRQAARWLSAAGVAVPVDASGLPTVAIEISPLFALTQEQFVERWSKLSPQPQIRDGLLIA